MFDKDPTTAIMGKDIMHFETSLFPEFFQNKGGKELKETAEIRSQSLRQIKDLFKSDPLMKKESLYDDFILMFLRAKLFNVEEAFSCLKSFTMLVQKNPKVFTNFRYETLVKAIKKNLVSILPWRCHEGCMIIIIESDNWDPEDFPLDEIKRICMVIYLQALRYPMTQVNGCKFILHSTTATLKQLKHCTPQNLYFFLHGALKCLPARYRRIHVISNTYLAKTSWMIVKQFISEKMKKRVIFHQSKAELLNYFPREILPVSYGGTLENYDMSHWLQRMMQPEELEIMIGRSPQKVHKIIND